MRFVSCISTLAILLVMLLGMSPFGAFALASGDFTYEISDDGTVSVTAYSGSDATVTVPDTIDGMNVTAIGKRAFEGNATLTQIVFPSTLQSIGYSAFASCTGLTSISFPDALKSIGEQAFYNCYNLSTIDIGPYTYDIGYQAFTMTAWMNNAEWGELYLGRVLYAYVGLMEDDTVITVKDGTAAIAPYAFQNRHELSAIYLPVGLRSIGSMAFLNCSGLAEIRIPPSVEKIGNGAFINSSAAAIYGVEGTLADTYAAGNEMFFTHDSTLDYLDGDMNKDGIVNTVDARILLRVIAGADIAYDQERYLSSDFHYDGTIDTTDLRIALRTIVSTI